MAKLEIEVAGGDTATPLNLAKRLRVIERIAGRVDGMRAIDCGCGGGEYVGALRAAGANAVGVEYQKAKLLGETQPGGSRTPGLAAADIQALPFPDRSFDLAVVNEVLEHVPDDLRALREVYRVLAPGGALVVFSPNRLYPFETHGVFLKRSGRKLAPSVPGVPYLPIRIGKRWFRYWARNYWPGELRRLVARAGFTVVDRTFVWQTFENISGQQPGWISRSRFALRALANRLERIPGLRAFGVSQAILARREPDPTGVVRIGDVTLRPATAAEPQRLARVEDEAGALFEEIGMPEVAEMPARDPASLQAAQAAGLLWVADSAADGLVGFALAEPLGDALHLEELSVIPTHGRRGIGAGLVACVAEAAVLRGYTAMTLSTFADVPWNAPYYRRLGFVEIAAADLSPELCAVRAREAEAGLAVDRRVIMRRALVPEA